MTAHKMARVLACVDPPTTPAPPTVERLLDERARLIHILRQADAIRAEAEAIREEVTGLIREVDALIRDERQRPSD